MDFVTTALILAWAAILLLALVVSRLVHQVHRLSGRDRRPAPLGLPPGSPAPVAGPRPAASAEPASSPGSTSAAPTATAERTAPTGPTASIGSAPTDATPLLDPTADTTLLVFLSADCRTCADVLHEVSARAAEAPYGGAVATRLLYPDAAPAEAADATVPVLTGQAALFAMYDVPATPFAVVVTAGRIARSEPLGSRQAARVLLTELDTGAAELDTGAGADPHPSAPRVGRSA